MTYGSSIFTSWFQIICGSQRSHLEFVLYGGVVEVDIECESLINHYNVSEVDLESKFKDMRFNPSRFESIDKK